MEQGHRRGIQSVERALRILEVISQAKEGASLSEISGAVGLDHSTAHNLLLTLKQCEYVFQPKPNGRYYLGYRALQLSRRSPARVPKASRSFSPSRPAAATSPSSPTPIAS